MIKTILTTDKVPDPPLPGNAVLSQVYSGLDRTQFTLVFTSKPSFDKMF